MLLSASFPTLAAVVDIKFDSQGRFVHSSSIAPGKFVELCGPLPANDRIAWSFDAGAPLDFNIHYHVGDKVEFPEKRTGVDRVAGTLDARSAQDYCWMWTSGAPASIPIKVELRRVSPSR